MQWLGGGETGRKSHGPDEEIGQKNKGEDKVEWIAVSAKS